MSILSFLWLLFVPKILNLPTLEQDFSDYLMEIKLTQIQPWKRNVAIGVLFALTILLSTLMINLIAGEYEFDLLTIFAQPESGKEGFLTFIYNTIPAIWEEIAFRGVILALLLKKYSNKTAIILDGVLFGSFHLINLFLGGDVLFTIGQIFATSFMGFVFSYMVVKTESIIPPMIAHYVNNAFQPLVSNAIITNMEVAVIAQIFMVLVYFHVGILIVYLITRD